MVAHHVRGDYSLSYGVLDMVAQEKSDPWVTVVDMNVVDEYLNTLSV